MKKTVLLGALLVSAAVGARAQESRQDASISGLEVVAPQVSGNAVLPMRTTLVTGILGSYRYLLTPRSGLELNYGWAQNSLVYNAYSAGVPIGRVHTREQEISAAYVYSRNYKNFNPFVEGGVGGMIFTPILDNGTTRLDTRQNTRVGGLFGAGVAYEISPSFDIRAEYRGFVLKVPDFGVSAFTTNRYYVISTPSIGVAYHF
ncbi:MAG TPA: outer membrane beta-barrel protein [Acidobacteriaceae bacterium]|nr:outer membrane beta-barrel protein [Acidobacteriaceae bacterium]